MDDLRTVLRDVLNEKLIQMTLSHSRRPEMAEKLKLRPVRIRETLFFQETLYRGTQVFHANYQAEETVERLAGYLTDTFRQAQMVSETEEITVLVSKKGTVTIKRKKKAGKAQEDGMQKPSRELAHNRVKQYILREGEPVDFLVGLGVQTADGRVTKAYYDKFRQINRYLEFIEDILDQLPTDRTIRIIDFGCGKSYLTFAMYYYLHQLQGRDIRVTGLDLKPDVIGRCNRLAEQLQYENLSFEVGDIKSYGGEDQVDMVVSLHACDKATDYALEKAVKWGARVILAVPCCQHELNGQISCELLQPVLKYGIIKERMAALITDALRADILEQHGYETQILEFIDLEHTPKNLLIRAVRTGRMRPASGKVSPEQTMEFLRVHPTLKELV